MKSVREGILLAVCGAVAISAVAGETEINPIGAKTREEIVEFFTDNEFGRRPPAAEKLALLKFEKASDDKPMPDGKMVRKQTRIVYVGQYGTNSFVAPRLLAVGSGTEDVWAGPEGEQKATELARAAWKDPSCVSYHIHPGKHVLGLYDLNVYLSLAERHLRSSEM